MSATREKVTDMLGLLVRQPRTVPELSTLTGMDQANIRQWLKLWLKEGLVVSRLGPKPERGATPSVYEWVK